MIIVATFHLLLYVYCILSIVYNTTLELTAKLKSIIFSYDLFLDSMIYLTFELVIRICGSKFFPIFDMYYRAG